MKFWEIIRFDIDPSNRTSNGTTILKRSANKQKVDAFVKEWENEWQKNLDNKCSIIGHSWMDCKKNLKIIERELED